MSEKICELNKKGGGGAGALSWIGTLYTTSTLTELQCDIPGYTYTSPNVYLPQGSYRVRVFFSWFGGTSNSASGNIYKDGVVYQRLTSNKLSFYEFNFNISAGGSIGFADFNRSSGTSGWSVVAIIEQM